MQLSHEIFYTCFISCLQCRFFYTCSHKANIFVYRVLQLLSRCSQKNVWLLETYFCRCSSYTLSICIFKFFRNIVLHNLELTHVYTACCSLLLHTPRISFECCLMICSCFIQSQFTIDANAGPVKDAFSDLLKKG